MAKYFGKAPAGADTVVLLYKGKAYEIYDAFETKADAMGVADKDALVADLGKDAGRLRYGVFRKR